MQQSYFDIVQSRGVGRRKYTNTLHPDCSPDQHRAQPTAKVAHLCRLFASHALLCRKSFHQFLILAWAQLEHSLQKVTCARNPSTCWDKAGVIALIMKPHAQTLIITSTSDTAKCGKHARHSPPHTKSSQQSLAHRQTLVTITSFYTAKLGLGGKKQNKVQPSILESRVVNRYLSYIGYR